MDKGENKVDRILVIAPKLFPTDHSFLESVFVDMLPGLGIRVYLILNGTYSFARLKRRTWGKTKVYVRPGLNSKTVVHKILNSIIIRLNHLLIPFIILGVKPDIIFVRTELLTPFIALALSKLSKRRMRVYYHYNWPFYDDAYTARLRVLNIPTVLRKIRQAMEQKLVAIIFRKVHHVFTISSAMRLRLISEGKVEGSRTSVLPLAANYIDDLPLKRSVWRKRIRRELDIEDRFVAIYIGSLKKIREPEILIEITCHAIREIGSSFYLLIIGADSEEEKRYLLDLARRSGASAYLTIMERIKRHRVPQFICSADVGLSPIPLTSFFEVSSPTKVYEYMSVGCPFVSSKIPEVVDILQKAQCGILADHKTPSYVEAIQKLYNSTSLRESCRREGLRYIREVHNYQIIARNLLSKCETYE